MTVVAAPRPEQPFRLQEILRFLRRNEDRLVIAALYGLVFAMVGIALLANISLARGTATGTCERHVGFASGYAFLTMH
jgi:hypothetical protein